MTALTRVYPTFRRNDYLSSFEDAINKMFNDISNPQSNFYIRGSYPRADVYQEGNDLIFEFAVPFCKKEDVQIMTKLSEELPGRYDIRIIGQPNAQSNERKYINRELKRGKFERVISVDRELVDRATESQAELKNGVLSLIFKDAFKPDPESLPKQIEIH